MTTRRVDRASARVVLVPFVHQGHITPMLQLGQALRSRGISVIVAHTKYNSPNAAAHPELEFLSLGCGDISVSLNVIPEICGPSLEEFLSNTNTTVNCVIYDGNMFFARDVAARLNVPSIVLRPHCAGLLNDMSSAIRQQDNPDANKELGGPKIDSKVRSYYEKFITAKPSVGCIWNNVDCLDHSQLTKHQQDCDVPFFVVGPFNKLAPQSSTTLIEEDTSCFEWLDKQAPKSVVYVSYGSFPLDSENVSEVAEIAWGLANSGQHFLWALLADDSNALLPDGFEDVVGDRGKILKWAPQKEVLAHPAVGAFLTHCGWNSVLESMCAGVPMICRPRYADQFVINRYLTNEWKVGLELEKVERSVIEKKIRKLMAEDDDEGKDVKNEAIELKQKIDAAFTKDGSSTKALDELVHFIYALP